MREYTHGLHELQLQGQRLYHDNTGHADEQQLVRVGTRLLAQYLQEGGESSEECNIMSCGLAPAAASANIISTMESSLSVDQELAAASCKQRTTKLGLSPSIREAMSISLLRKATAELIGTFVIVLASGAGSIAAARGQSGQEGVAVGAGMAVTLMVWALAPISCAHLNPAVTFAFAFARLFPWHQVPAYVLSQIIGSLLASLSLQVIVHERNIFYLAINQPLHHSSASIVMEFMATFILMLINMKVACNLGQTGELGASFMIGSTNAVFGYYARPLCGSLSMNPARSIGFALVALEIKSLYIYILGPTAGAILSGLAYNGIKQT